MGAGPGRRWRAAVEQQLAILQSLIAAHHGVLYKTVGDGTAGRLCLGGRGAAGRCGQPTCAPGRGLGRAAGPLRVRMALHAGEAVPDAHGDYLAAPLNRLSRLLVSWPWRADPPLPDRPATDPWRPARGDNCGTWASTGCAICWSRSGSISCCIRTCRPSFPRSGRSGPPEQPPSPTDALFGPGTGGRRGGRAPSQRVRAPADPYGSRRGGKTRLGLQAAADLLDAFPDGVFFVELAPVTDPALVPSTVARVLGVRAEAGEPVMATLEDFLRNRRLLLLLDNVEHLLPAASLVSDLLRACPRLKVLATSRTPLRLRGEREFVIEPLALPVPQRRPDLQR